MKKIIKGIISTISRYFLLYTVLVVIAVSLLLIGCFFPQKMIDRKIQESVSLFENEGQYPRIGDKEDSSMLDNFTDCLILMESATMRNTELYTIFSNPLYFESNPVAEFSHFIEKRENSTPTSYYVRYWMGFRTPVRLMLTLMNYSQIRSVLAWLILGLLLISSFYIAHYTDNRAGMLYAFSIIFIKPQILCNSLQFSCCFILSMIAILFIPFVVKRKRERYFFFALGMITMYFDFYTSPLVVLGYPLIFMLLIKTDEKAMIKLSLFSMLGWEIGYGTMWLTKLLCATLFTEVNGFANGFHSFATRVGITKRSDLIEYYGVNKAFDALIRAVLPNTLSRVSACIILLGMFITTMIYIVHRKLRYDQGMKYMTILFPVVGMFIWYAVAAQPTAIHTYFQYRNVSMALWGCAMFYSLLFSPIKKRKLLL